MGIKRFHHFMGRLQASLAGQGFCNLPRHLIAQIRDLPSHFR